MSALGERTHLAHVRMGFFAALPALTPTLSQWERAIIYLNAPPNSPATLAPPLSFTNCVMIGRNLAAI